MKPKIENKICAVTVTYGNRSNYLVQVVKRLLSFREMGNVIVVNNGSEYNVAEALSKLNDARILVVDHQKNEGSAGGYYSGIKAAHTQTDNDFIWLLDDDNLPEEDALDQLLQAWEKLSAKTTDTALYSRRMDRALDSEFVNGKDPFSYFLIPNAILGVSYISGLRRKLEKIFNSSKTKHQGFRSFIRVPYVPYGGFFVHRDMVDIIGYPNQQFYLYVDDEDYTYRVTQQNGTIWMVTDSKIKDIDVADNRTAYRAKRWASPILDLWSFRMYYRVRNSIYFHNKISLDNKFIFTINKMVFFFKLKVLAIISGKYKEYKMFKQAAVEGINGQLGKADKNKFGV